MAGKFMLRKDNKPNKNAAKLKQNFQRIGRAKH